MLGRKLFELALSYWKIKPNIISKTEYIVEKVIGVSEHLVVFFKDGFLGNISFYGDYPDYVYISDGSSDEHVDKVLIDGIALVKRLYPEEKCYQKGELINQLDGNIDLEETLSFDDGCGNFVSDE